MRIFGELTFDITDKLAVTGGVRFFEAENSLKGFFGYSAAFSGMTGESQCFDQADFRTAPCINLDKTVKEDGNTKRLNVSFHATDDVMLYATWSEGFRPGGINRRGTIPPYVADFLTNYELGFKTTFADNRVRINGAMFQDDWDDFQYSFLGANGLTEIRNAGQARIKGIEADIAWAVTDRFTLSAAMSWLDAKTTDDYCGTARYDSGPNARPTRDQLRRSGRARRNIRAGAQGTGAAGAAGVQGQRRGSLRVPDGRTERPHPGCLGVPGRRVVRSAYRRA